VIARPFVGMHQSEFTRTTNRRDLQSKAACAGAQQNWVQDSGAHV